MSRTSQARAGKTAPSPQVQRSSSGRKAPTANTQPTSPLVEGNHLMRHIDRPPPGDVVRRASKSPPKTDLARQKSKRNFFEDAFSANPASPARERVHGDAIVMAEVKTNVIIRDEFTFITDLACQLSKRYQRPVSSVVVTLHHGACMFFGGSFDPAYALAVWALPSQLQPTTSKRNAALLQRHMEDALGVPAARGVLRFVPVLEEHLACGGKTMAGEIEELERGAGYYCQDGGNGDNGNGGVSMGSLAVMAEDGAPRGVRARRMLSVKSLAVIRPSSVSNMATPELTPPGSTDEEFPPMPGTYPKSAQDVEPGRKAAQRKKSFVATIFGRSGSKSSDRSSLPAIADEDGEA